MTPRSAAYPPVAHFRRVWFEPTETFLHNTVRSFTRCRPLLIGYERANAEAFPVDAPVLALHPPGSWSARLHHRLAAWRGADPHVGFHARRALRALARHGARVLHAHFGYTGWYALPVKRRTGLPLVTTFYGEDASRLPHTATWRERYAELFAEGDRFLVEGPALAEGLAKLGCPREKIAVQPIGIVPGRYRFRAREPRADGSVRLLFCASFREKKGLRYALEALALARREDPRLTLRVGGDGPGRAAAESLVAGLGLADAVSFLGFLRHEALLAELDDADLFIQPSVTAADGDSEGGAPTTLLEAQACGLPVLATRHADIPFVVPDGESGLLCPERDAEALARNLLALAKAPERWAPMGAAGREHVERFHDVDRETARLEDLYRSLAEERP